MGGGEGGRVCFGLFSFSRGNMDVSCPGRPLPAGLQCWSAGVPAFGRVAGVREAPPALLRSSGRGGASPGCGLYARPGTGGLVRAAGEGSERGFPRHPCGNQPPDLVLQMRHRNASWVGRNPRASGLGIGSISPQLSPCSLTAPQWGQEEGWHVVHESVMYGVVMCGATMEGLCVEHKAEGTGKWGKGGWCGQLRL